MIKMSVFRKAIFAGCLVSAAPLALATTPEDLGLTEADILNFLNNGQGPTTAPGISFGSPVAYGLDWGEAGIALGGTWDPGDVASKELDGSLALSLGLGDAEESFGVEIYGSINSLASQRGQDSFGSEGSFGAKLHTVLTNRSAVAFGVENIARFGKATQQTESSVYLVGTKFYDLRPKAQGFKYPLAVNVGVGNGRFLRENRSQNQANVFGSLELLLSPVHSVAVDWTGRDLNVGVSFLPLPRYPLVVTLGGVNLTHQEGRHAAYAANVGYLIRF